MSNRWLADLVDNFIPYSIWRTSPDPATIARARTLVAVLGFSIATPVVTLALVLALHFFTQYDFTPAIASLIGIIVLLVIQHMLFQASANLYVTSIAYSITFFLAMIVSTAMTGGWSSPVIPLLFCSPIMVFLISGWREAEYAVLLTFMTGVVFMVLDILHVVLPNLMHAENRAYAQGVVWFMACIILLLLFATQKWVHGLEKDDSPPPRKSIKRDDAH
ncbi:MAG TPA: hypothetical protein VLB90_08135 [Pseudomonadales bacterium]|nr:hypothetical protein [Pseudomonadales bacterium]